MADEILITYRCKTCNEPVTKVSKRGPSAEFNPRWWVHDGDIIRGEGTSMSLREPSLFDHEAEAA